MLYNLKKGQNISSYKTLAFQGEFMELLKSVPWDFYVEEKKQFLISLFLQPFKLWKISSMKKIRFGYILKKIRLKMVFAS